MLQGTARSASHAGRPRNAHRVSSRWWRSAGGSLRAMLKPFRRALPPLGVTTSSCRRGRRSTDCWATEGVLNDCGVDADGGPLHRQSNAYLGDVINSASRHEQGVPIQLASRLRQHLAAPMPLQRGARASSTHSGRGPAAATSGRAADERAPRPRDRRTLTHTEYLVQPQRAGGRDDRSRSDGHRRRDRHYTQLGMTANRSHPEPWKSKERFSRSLACTYTSITDGC